MTDKWVRGVLRCAVGVMGVAAVLMLCGTLAGVAHGVENSAVPPGGGERP
ncbi:hypothetical protein HTV80_11590 [Streptomyces sp. Vc74B-19]|nr:MULTISPECIES: hypothetical protein [unclassified Streptomyces]MBT3163750.1 hypothetical protein [Streptomyces sp. Vc74B-19]MCO4694901.1 hypothetical protein [Streptomyces sp. RO-S4]MDU0305091.1 hypothetical protein [Streptomyces sp. PAL114]